jgi:hypothetical protein
MTPLGRACSIGCAIKIAEQVRKVAERKDDKLRRQALKTRQDWLREAQAAVNALVRYRDREDGCISCDRPADWPGQWHASHFKSVGSSPALRFDLANIHKSCSICNNHMSGNIGSYAPRLLAKIGADEFARLNGPQPIVKHSIEDAQRIKATYKAKLKTLQEASHV